MSDAPTIELRELSRSYGDRVAVADVSLSIAAGERIALVGPSGSGKTTILRLLSAALAASSGEVVIGDQPVSTMTPAQIRAHRRRCGFVDQSAQLIPGLSVHDNVIAGAVPTWPWWRVLASRLWPIDRERVGARLAEVGLGQRQWDRADRLSGGEQQRVAIARALAADQSVLLADEPTAALDPTTAKDIVELLFSEADRRRATVVVSSHRLSQVRDQVDRVIGLREGAVVFDREAGKLDSAELDRLYEGTRERAG